jgi:hypothetical protein
MPSLKLEIWNKRMLELMAMAIHTGKCENMRDWCDVIGFHESNITHIKQKTHSFRIQHIINAAKFMNTSVDWIVGLTNNMKTNYKTMSGIDLIKEGVRLIESNKKK